MRRLGARGRRRDQRGAVAVFVAGTLAVLLLIGALAVDLNMQRAAARDAQAAADLIALDVARELDGSTYEDYSQADLRTVFAGSVSRNAGGLGADPDSFGFELVVEQPDGEFVPAGVGDIPDAVRVRTSGGVDRFFFSGASGVARSAVATADNSACFRVGSFVAGLDSSQGALLGPLLNGLLGSSVNLNAVSYQGLANANVSLLALVETGQLAVGTVDELLALPALRVADLFIASARVLDQQGNLAQADVLRLLAAQVGTPTLAVGELLDVGPAADAALSAGLNVLDLVTTTAFVISKGRTVNVPDLRIDLPGVGTVSTTLTVIEPLRTGCRNTGGSVETAQIRLRVEAVLDASVVNGLLGVVAGLGNVVEARLDANPATPVVDPTTLVLDVNLGQAIATLLAVDCTPDGPASMTLNLESSVLGSTTVSLSTGLQVRVNDPVTRIVDLLTGFLGLGNIFGTPNRPYLQVSASTALRASTQPTTSYDRTVVLPLPGAYEVPQGSGSGPVLGPLVAQSATNLNVVSHYYNPGVLGIGGRWETRTVDAGPLLTTVVNGVLGSVTGLLNPLVRSLQDLVVTPLSRLLGLQLGGADVFAVRQPGCGVPKLIE